MSIPSRRLRPSRWHVAALAVAVALPLGLASPATSGPPTATKVRVVLTSRWAKPSTDPSGLAYLAGRKALIVVDSEVEEGPHYDGANIWFSKLGGRVIKTFNTSPYSVEPTDVAVGRSGRTIFLVDDSEDALFVLHVGPDLQWATADDSVDTINTRLFGSRDPAGLGWGGGFLFISDGDNTDSDHRIYRLRTGPNGVYDGVAPQGDDRVTSFDTEPLGISEPSDVVFHKPNQHLYLVGQRDDLIAEATLTGALVRTFDISASRIKAPAGIVIAPGSRNADLTHVYVADRGVDNDPDQGGGAWPGENDGRIFEFALSTL